MFAVFYHIPLDCQWVKKLFFFRFLMRLFLRGDHLPLDQREICALILKGDAARIAGGRDCGDPSPAPLTTGTGSTLAQEALNQRGRGKVTPRNTTAHNGNERGLRAELAPERGNRKPSVWISFSR